MSDLHLVRVVRALTDIVGDLNRRLGNDADPRNRAALDQLRARLRQLEEEKLCEAAEPPPAPAVVLPANSAPDRRATGRRARS